MEMDKRLREKLDKEYGTYMDHVRQMPSGKILQNIEEIGAMHDVYAYVVEYGEFDEKERDYLLEMDAPLHDLRDQWLYNDKDISDSLNQSLWNLCTLEEEDEWEPET